MALLMARIDDRLIEIDRHYRQAVASLAEWTGAAATRPIATRLPDWQAMPSPEELQQNLHAHPALLAAEAWVSAKDAEVGVAEEDKKPGWSIDVGYGYREGELPNGDPRSDFISVAVTTELPIFRKNRQDRALAAALRERSAAGYRKEQLHRRLSSELDAAYVRWQDLDRQAKLYESSMLSLSADHAQAALLAGIEPGDEVILTDPGFASHYEQIRLHGGVPVAWLGTRRGLESRLVPLAGIFPLPRRQDGGAGRPGRGRGPLQPGQLHRG